MTDTKFIDTVTGKLHLKLTKTHLTNHGLPATGDDEAMSMDDFSENVADIRVPSSETANQLSKKNGRRFGRLSGIHGLLRTRPRRRCSAGGAGGGDVG